MQYTRKALQKDMDVKKAENRRQLKVNKLSLYCIGALFTISYPKLQIYLK